MSPPPPGGGVGDKDVPLPSPPEGEEGGEVVYAYSTLRLPFAMSDTPLCSFVIVVPLFPRDLCSADSSALIHSLSNSIEVVCSNSIALSSAAFFAISRSGVVLLFTVLPVTTYPLSKSLTNLHSCLFVLWRDCIRSVLPTAKSWLYCNVLCSWYSPVQ